MFVRADTVLSQVDLETVTPEEALSIMQQLPADILHSAHFTYEEALSIMQQLPADILHSAHFTYYEGLFRAMALVAEAALRNQGRQNGPTGIPV